MNNKTYPKLFACCIPVLGKSRAAICDIQRQTYQLIPDSLYEILTKHEGKTLATIKAAYNNEYDETIQEYFDFLVEKEYVFFTDTPELFPKMSMHWEEPVDLTNAIIDISTNSSILDFGDLFDQFEDLGCEHLQIRCFSDKPLSFFEDIVKKADRKRIISIEFIVKYQADFTKEKLLKLGDEYPRIASITAHTAPSDETLYISEQGMGHLFYTKAAITSANHCGIISPDFFVLNIKSFTEAQHHNSCLNRKIAIDVNGNIKNCPSMADSYGHISTTSLKQALAHKDFKQHWNITKDEIAGCKDCEFRYICTDCRAYIEQPADIYSKPLKCGYDPNTGEWEEWSTNPLKEKAINHYNMEAFVSA